MTEIAENARSGLPCVPMLALTSTADVFYLPLYGRRKKIVEPNSLRYLSMSSEKDKSKDKAKVHRLSLKGVSRT